MGKKEGKSNLAKYYARKLKPFIRRANHNGSVKKAYLYEGLVKKSDPELLCPHDIADVSSKYWR